MTLPTETQPITDEVVYPESDGQPMADNTRQFEWITTIKGGLDALFRHYADVFVAGNLFWYAQEGEPDACRAPDVLVVFGRPKGHRESYQQWNEDDIAPQIVFEILSPRNTVDGMFRTFEFYDRHGVEEYYLYDPKHTLLTGWQRRTGQLRLIEQMAGWVSPWLGIRFDMSEEEMRIYHPNGKPFLTYAELAEQTAQAEAARQQAEQQTERLAAKLREWGIDPASLS